MFGGERPAPKKAAAVMSASAPPGFASVPPLAGASTNFVVIVIAIRIANSGAIAGDAFDLSIAMIVNGEMPMSNW